MNAQASSLTRILFVDDSKVMVKTASKILGAEFDVVTAVDGDDAWAKLEHDHAIQVLFTDINMPGTDGYQLLNKVRTADDQGLRNMPVILVTGADDDEAARQKALDRGATDFINKRSTSSELLPRARAHARYQRITRQLQAQCTLDPVTGLANETGFFARLEQDIAYALRHRQDWALMRIEVDGLTSTFQDCGDEVVEQIVLHVAYLIRKRIRKEDTAAHVGLGGFAISAPGGQIDGIETVAGRLQADAREHPLEFDGRSYPITLSTAVIGAEPEIWSNAADAMERCLAVLDRNRRKAAANIVAQPRPQVSEPVPPPVAIKARKPDAVPATPAHATRSAAPVREAPAQGRDAGGDGISPNVLRRLLAFLGSSGRKLGAGVARIVRKLVGR